MLGQLTTLLKPFNEITGLIGAILGIISLAAAIYFYYKSKFEKRPCFGVFSQTILSGAKSALKGLQVSFQWSIARSRHDIADNILERRARRH